MGITKKSDNKYNNNKNRKINTTFVFSIFAFSLAGNILLYTPSQDTNK